MLFMVVERFKDADAVYRRFREQGRMLPEGVAYVASWPTADRTRCFQLMECGDARMLDAWTARWSDLVDFEIVEVTTSAEAVKRAGA
jgi:Protein of unknown function (DUF3303)